MLNQLDDGEFLKLLLIMPNGYMRTRWMKKCAKVRPFLCDLVANSYGHKFNLILLKVMQGGPKSVEDIQTDIISEYPYHDAPSENLTEKVKLIRSLTSMEFKK